MNQQICIPVPTQAPPGVYRSCVQGYWSGESFVFDGPDFIEEAELRESVTSPQADHVLSPLHMTDAHWAVLALAMVASYAFGRFHSNTEL